MTIIFAFVFVLWFTVFALSALMGDGESKPQSPPDDNPVDDAPEPVSDRPTALPVLTTDSAGDAKRRLEWAVLVDRSVSDMGDGT